MKQRKISDKQYDFLISLYKQQGKTVTPEVENWLDNLPADQAPMYIEKGLDKVKKRRNVRQSWLAR